MSDYTTPKSLTGEHVEWVMPLIESLNDARRVLIENGITPPKLRKMQPVLATHVHLNDLRANFQVLAKTIITLAESDVLDEEDIKGLLKWAENGLKSTQNDEKTTENDPKSPENDPKSPKME